MSSIRVLNRVCAGARPSLSVTSLRQAPRMTAVQQIRSTASKGEGEKDDLGGPGGQEPPDPTARAKQNAGFRSTAVGAVGMILIVVPIFYMVAKPDKVGEVSKKI